MIIMTISIEVILAYGILIPFIFINLFFSMGSLFQKKVSKFLQKIFKEEEKFKASQYNKFKLVNILIWIAMGSIIVFLLDDPISLGALIVFLAFRSGATLSMRFIFGIHDVKIMKHQLSDKKVNKIISLVLKVGIIVELLFLLVWGILYRYLSMSVKTRFGLEVNILAILLWITGFIYGIIFSVIQSSLSKYFLLRNEIGIVLVLSGQLIREKIEKKKNLVQRFFKL